MLHNSPCWSELKIVVVILFYRIFAVKTDVTQRYLMQSHVHVEQVLSGWLALLHVIPKIEVGPESKLLVTAEVDTGISQKQ